jgi:RNA polymerase sigma factor (sigma-70 family)
MRAKEFIQEAQSPLAKKLAHTARYTQAARQDPDYQYYGGKRTLDEPVPMQPQKPVAIPDTSSVEKTEHNIEMAQVRKILSQQISTLPDNAQKVLKMRYWMGMSLADIARSMGLSPERIRQIEAKGLRMLRHPTRTGQLSYYANQQKQGTPSITSQGSYQQGYQDGKTGEVYSPSGDYSNNDKEYYRQGYVAGYDSTVVWE